MDGGQNMELQKDSSHPSASLNANLSATTTAIQKWLEKLRKERKKERKKGTSETPLTAKRTTPVSRAVAISWGALLIILGSCRWQCASNNFIIRPITLHSLSLWLCAPGILFFPVKKIKEEVHSSKTSIQSSDTCISNTATSHGPFYFLFFQEYYLYPKFLFLVPKEFIFLGKNGLYITWT